jgi:hypothetical protein
LAVVWAIGWWGQRRWALFGAAATLTLVGIVFIWRSSVSWLAYLGGESQKLTAALLITAMFVATALRMGSCWACPDFSDTSSE